MKDLSHEALFSDATLKLGEIHGAILKSAHLMDKERWVADTHKSTDFGKQVGQDEIHWWIFGNETDNDELLKITKEALKAAQTLKAKSEKLKNNEPESYEALLVTLKEFADKHGNEIEALHRYVMLLEHPMAPRMLFTYRIWGSTRMADRDMKLDGEQSERWPPDIINALAETVLLGVRQRNYPVYLSTHHEVGFEIYESLDLEVTPPDYEIVPPEKTVVRRTARTVYDNCATYFSEIRDSLRNIEIDIEKFAEEQELAAAQRARWAKIKGRKVVSIATRKRTMSPAARRKIAAAQKARWAKLRRTKWARQMPFDGQPCRHQLDRPPEVASDVDGISYLVFECVLCGCEVSLRLNSDGEIDGEFIVPPSRKRA